MLAMLQKLQGQFSKLYQVLFTCKKLGTFNDINLIWSIGAYQHFELLSKKQLVPL